MAYYIFTSKKIHHKEEKREQITVTSKREITPEKVFSNHTVPAESHPQTLLHVSTHFQNHISPSQVYHHRFFFWRQTRQQNESHLLDQHQNIHLYVLQDAQSSRAKAWKIVVLDPLKYPHDLEHSEDSISAQDRIDRV